MTREEAIELLRSWDGVYIGYSSDEVEEAHEMAIKALSQEPCDDAISREDAREAFFKWFFDSKDLRTVDEVVDKLPSVTQKSETETWNGIHGQITAPKGTFKKIFDDAESEDKK